MTARRRVLFFLGDCAAGALTGAATALVVRAVVAPGFDMVAAMMLGMLVGTAVHLVLGVALSPVLGMFETMVPGMFIGMHGGMLFGMRDSMQHNSLSTALWVGAVLGALVVAVVEFWSAQLRRRTVVEVSDTVAEGER
ncbi:MAG TPA: hypothetical protein VJB15_08185 [Rhodothermia bacterium]|nr:hypothetical protein [Rhodothermia bacterium]